MGIFLDDRLLQQNCPLCIPINQKLLHLLGILHTVTSLGWPGVEASASVRISQPILLMVTALTSCMHDLCFFCALATAGMLEHSGYGYYHCLCMHGLSVCAASASVISLSVHRCGQPYRGAVTVAACLVKYSIDAH